MKTAPFDLELAKLGHPLITSNGRKVLEFHTFDVNISWPVRAVLCALEELHSFDNSGKSFMRRTGDLLLDLETPWEKPLQQGEEILCQDKMGAWIPRIFEAEVKSKNIVVTTCKTTDFYMAYTKWKRPEPVKQETTKLDITLDVKINGKDISKEDKNKFMVYLKKFVNEVL